MVKASNWRLKKFRINFPEKTGNVSGDSTFNGFRECFARKFRELGYDLEKWACVDGSTELAVPEALVKLPAADLTIECPNGFHGNYFRRLPRYTGNRES